MAKSLTDTIHRRADVNTAIERLRREIERAARRGDLDQHDADDMIDIIADAVSVLDEAIYAELNADHFGRLSADQRHFARELDATSPPPPARSSGAAATCSTSCTRMCARRSRWST